MSPAPPAPAPEPTPSVEVVEPQDDSDDETVKDEHSDDDQPPAFPALSSAQRAGPSSVPRILTDTELMPPPPQPSLASRNPGLSAPKSSGSNLLALPPSTTKPPVRPSSKREKVALAPGYGPLDWAKLKSSGQNLRGVDMLLRVPPSELKKHNKLDDAWTAINGKVYNITRYLPFHPGGEKELMRVAGRDGTKLFMLTHAWVNADFMLDSCMVGFLTSEPL
ncbi:cytochrome b5 [Gloeophyllum trabeum ATCC 11539]|uniref:Cytochrome b5 n=1 Tax=Gloeophyllum trabeum (strain ATCC 11539 / FP-39264 / Madison 617) TaxID=670483 RepID=S7PYQ0_GLOTA|nr:cytochrome b5 [Gloeophyllum trabeum ATCC 11539]EPQ52578.1 cytochrome b5 [Gloeophyllum trabeum ATCC 11539]